jgi:hypothetical protein
MSRMIAAFVTLVSLAFLPTRADAETLSLVGISTKVCQLTGQIDWVTNQPTAAQTQSNAGLIAIDLGFPVDSGKGPLYFLFGDARPISHPPFGIIMPDDALGWTTRTAPPDPQTCLDMQLVKSGPHTFAHPTVMPPIDQGTFNVPSGGTFIEGNFYAFFWTQHCSRPNLLAPDPIAPETLPVPPMGSNCPEGPVNNSIGYNVLAVSRPSNPASFVWTIPPNPTYGQFLFHMPSGFAYVSSVETKVDIDPKDPHQRDVPVFGAARYRASIPYLAMAPRNTFGDPDTWSFFGGLDAGGNPQWLTRAQWESGRNGAGQWLAPPGAELYAASPPGERCVGEHSVTWNEPLHRWLLLYNCRLWNIEARFAPDPWGPWSPPTSILNLAQPVLCTLIMSENGCPGQATYWPPLPSGKPTPGFFYAPFVLNRYTQAEPPQGPGSRSATIYWLVSTWNPYQVVVMRSTLALTP